MIDGGKEAGKSIQPGAVKFVGIDVANDKVIAKIALPEGVYLPQSHMNDLRVDLTNGADGTAFATQSSFCNEPALVVADITIGKSRHIFEPQRFIAADLHLITYLEVVPHVCNEEKPGSPIGGADGIELNPDSSRLYWTSLSGRQLYSAPTAILSDANATPQSLDAVVRDEGERPNADGLACDPDGRIYFGAFDQQSIARRNTDGSFQLVALDDRLGWPDGLFVSNGYPYVTLGQWNRMASMNGGKELRKPPYLLVRMHLPQ
jgi:sugar lactone lactonase YvrE